MEELKSLVLKHRFAKNNFRTNLGGDIQTKYKRPMLVEGVYSNTLRNGPMIELVQKYATRSKHYRTMLKPKCCMWAAQRPRKQQHNKLYYVFWGL